MKKNGCLKVVSPHGYFYTPPERCTQKSECKNVTSPHGYFYTPKCRCEQQKKANKLARQ